MERDNIVVRQEQCGKSDEVQKRPEQQGLTLSQGHASQTHAVHRLSQGKEDFQQDRIFFQEEREGILGQYKLDCYESYSKKKTKEQKIKQPYSTV